MKSTILLTSVLITLPLSCIGAIVTVSAILPTAAIIPAGPGFVDDLEFIGSESDGSKTTYRHDLVRTDTAGIPVQTLATGQFTDSGTSGYGFFLEAPQFVITAGCASSDGVDGVCTAVRNDTSTGSSTRFRWVGPLVPLDVVAVPDPTSTPPTNSRPTNSIPAQSTLPPAIPTPANPTTQAAPPNPNPTTPGPATLQTPVPNPTDGAPAATTSGPDNGATGSPLEMALFAVVLVAGAGIVL